MKGKRQETVLEIIKNNVILTQDDLQNALKDYGYDVTQSTVSRDIRQLKLIKDHDSEGNYRYVTVDRAVKQNQSAEHYRDMIKGTVISVDYAVNNVVVKCHNGMASSTCVSLDNMFSDRMLGSVAGDDTIIIITRDEESSRLLSQEINEIKK